MLSVPQIGLYLWPNFTDPLKGTLPAASQVAFLLPNPILYLDNPDFLAVWNKRKRNWSVLWMNKLPGDLFSEKHVFHINPWKKKLSNYFFFFWPLPPIAGKATSVIKMRCSLCSLLFVSEYLIWWNSQLIHILVFSFCDFWLIATSALCFQFLLWHYRR